MNVADQENEIWKLLKMKVANRKNDIWELLEKEENRTVILFGNPGVGKTWTAREVSNFARQNRYIVLWAYLNKKYEFDTLRDSIAQQLSLLPTRGVSEIEEDEEESKKEEVLKDGEILKKIGKGKLLIVLDDEGNKMKESEVTKLLNDLWESEKHEKPSYTVLVTTRKDPTTKDSTSDEITTPNDPTNMGIGRKFYKVEPMVKDESESLLRERASWSNDIPGFNTLAASFLQRTGGMPNSIIMMAKAFKYFSNKEKRGMLLRRSFDEPSDSKIYNITDLLRCGYKSVPYSLLIDCQRDANDKEKPFSISSRCINHNELIAYWMMEGYLGPVNCMEMVYRMGHEILMELLDFQILKRVEADYVTINPLRHDFGEEFDDFLLRKASDNYRLGYYGNAHLGLDSVFDSVEWKGFGRISHKGGVMRTLPCGKDEKIISVLLLDGNSLAKDSPSKFMSSIKELQVLAIFNPTEDILSPFLEIILKLHVFVLRSCQFMKNMDWVQRMEFINLTVLELSGPLDSSGTEGSTFQEFPEKFFKETPKLQSLNLSSLPIIELPKSFYELFDLKWLILRDCTSLKTLSSLKDFVKLVVLDCSGSISLDGVQDRSFMNTKLEMINLSSTNIKTLPLLTKLESLTHLLLCNCPSLNRLPGIKAMTSLEVIDLSNVGNFNEFYDKSFENLVNLKILDLSGTAVSNLPVNVGNPRHLCLENCTQLTGNKVLECLTTVTNLERFVLSNATVDSLPDISKLTNLRQLSVTRCLKLKTIPDLSSHEKMEELDFSGCKNIKSVSDKAFYKMCRLHMLNLSGTSIESLPSLEYCSNLRHLLLKDCKKLKKLPSVESTSLQKLEELNIRGGKALTEIGANFFDGAVSLRILDLSDTQLKELPSLSKQGNLYELHLRNCKSIVQIPDLEKLTTLEILDLSGSGVSNLPPLPKPSKLRQLMLNNCSSLSIFREKGTFNVLVDSVGNLPAEISELTSLERLDLPGMDFVQEADKKEGNSERADSNELKIMEAKLDGCEWGISCLSGPKEKRSSVNVSGTQFLHPLEENPTLWDSKFKTFHLCAYDVKELDAKSVLHFHGDDFAFRDIYLKNRHIGELVNQRLLEIYGFPGYKPDGLDTIISHANQIFFIDNKFQERIPAIEKKEEGIPTTKIDKEEKIQMLPSFLTACDSEQVKGCWIEKCCEIEVIFSDKMIDKIIGLLNSVETLWVSNAISLKSILENSKDNIFKNLEKLYLECCSKLLSVLSKLPQKLKILQIKFCDELETVFGVKSEDSELQYLEALHLWELPKLKSIGCQLPSLKSLRISNCPKLQNLEETIRSAKSLENLYISNVHDLKSIQISKELKYLSIDSCPNLLNISTSSPVPSDLEIHIRFCDKLKTAFEEGMPPEISFRKLHLHGLPKLESIAGTLPNQAKPIIVDCLNLKNVA